MIENFNSIRKYNFWDGKTHRIGLYRKLYISRINNFIGNNLIKVLVGQRRVGKSYILRQIINELIDKKVKPNNILYINKEFTEFDFISDYKSLGDFINFYRNELKPNGKVFLFIDEIQNIDGWEKLINSYSQNFVEDYEIFVSGSNSNLLSGELATLLSGRYVEFNIFSFSYLEYIEHKKIINSKESFLQFLQTGGMPQLYSLPDFETQRHYISSIKDTVILRDIVQRYGIKDAKLLEDIFIYIVNNASNMFSINKIVNYFNSKNRKTNYETVSNYIEYLRNTFLIHKVDRFNIKGKEIISGNHKYYLNDLSFKNYLYSGFEYGVGYLLENIVFLNLIGNGYKVYTGVFNNKEIDFVATKNDNVIYLQVAYMLNEKKTIEREYGELEKINDNYEKYIISMDDIQMPNRNGIKHRQVWKMNDIL